MTAKVLVIGGGYAGVAAATSLAEMGVPVELLESRGSLGGRVYSTSPSDRFPAPVDNGPHLFMGCYQETLKLFQRLQVPDPFHWVDPLELHWFLPGGKKVSLECAPLPSPFHLAWGLFFSDAFPWKEKGSLIRALSAFSRKPFRFSPDVETVAQYLDAKRQGPTTRERFWVPLCNSVMNVPIQVAPIRGLAEVLNRIFFGNRRDSALAIPARPLSELAFPQVAPFLERKGGAVRFHEGVQVFKPGPLSFEVTTRSGKTLAGDALIWAVPPSSLAALWPSGTWKPAETLSGLGKSPIVSVHLILSKMVTILPFVGLAGAKFEWAFNRNGNWGLSTKGQYLSFTSSAAEELAAKSEKELVDLALQELRERCPEAQNAGVLHAKVTKEMAATFRWTKETDPLRLPCETPFPHIFLAGDWTATGLPATIEGACFSGHRAAEKVKAYLAGKG